MPDTDPFAGHGLPENADDQGDESSAGSDQRPASGSGQPAARQSSRPAWVPAEFEVEPGKGYRQCQLCRHFVPGGNLAIDQIFEMRSSADLIDFADECKRFDREFELRELQQIVEKAKTLDDRYDQRPRVKSHCAVKQKDYSESHLIPEIKNHDQQCGDFSLGRRPFVTCSDCAEIRPASRTRPSQADYLAGYDELDIHNPDFMPEHAGPAIASGLSKVAELADKAYQNATKEYEVELQADVSEAIYGDRMPINGTIDECRKFSRACAVINRSNHCAHFTKAGMLFDLGLGPPATPADWAAFDQAMKQATLARRPNVVKTDDHVEAPCWGCEHKRDPVKIDPFAEVHVHNREIMDLRAEYEREMRLKVQEERRICAGPGNALGDAEVPRLYAWCDKYSQKGADGRIREYAYCYRALKAFAAGGECPGYSSARLAHERWEQERKKAAEAKAQDPFRSLRETLRKELKGSGLLD